jgi:predicted phosphodiesterase
MKTVRITPIAAVVLAFVLMLSAPAVSANAEMPNLLDRTPVSGAQWTNDTQKFHFAVLGDRRGGGENEWPLFDRAIAELNLLQPDFVIMVGDAIEGYAQDPKEIASEWEEFHRHVVGLQAPLFLLPGNHDISSPNMLRWWQERIGRTYYAFDCKGCHFLVLNTQEYWLQNDCSIGPDQVRFALEDLERSKAARHTFVFIHVPVWEDANNADWGQIEAALGNRPHTVFAGHTHRLTFERRDGSRYFIVATTRGMEPLRAEDKIPQLGLFPHYTQVTVDGGAVRVALIEPGGPMWPEDVATREFQEAVRRLINVSALLPEELDSGEVRTGVAACINNALPESVEVTIEVSPTGEDGWRLVQGDSTQTLSLPSGAARTVECLFSVAASKVVPVPRLRCTAKYGGKLLYGFDRNMPLFPESALMRIPEWQVVGPFDVSPLPNTLPDDPREAMPKVFLVRGPEQGYVAGATFAENGTSLLWQAIKTEAGYVNLARLCETPTHVLAYASCGIHSPASKTVYAEFRADDYAQILVNGTGIEDDRLFRTRSDATYVSLPLKAGWNTVVVKCVNITGGWTFRLLPADPASELRFAPYPE